LDLSKIEAKYGQKCLDLGKIKIRCGQIWLDLSKTKTFDLLRLRN